MAKKQAIEFVWNLSKSPESMNRVSGLWSHDQLEEIVKMGNDSGLEFTTGEFVEAVKESGIMMPLPADMMDDNGEESEDDEE